MALAVIILAFTIVSVSLIPTLLVAESPAEVYWKAKLGNETAMPRIVQDGLMGSEQNVNSLLKTMKSKGFKVSNQLKASIRKGQEVWFYNPQTFKVTDQLDASIRKGQEVWFYNPQAFKVTDQLDAIFNKGKEVWFYNKNPKAFKVTDQLDASINKGKEVWFYNSQGFNVNNQQEVSIQKGQEVWFYNSKEGERDVKSNDKSAIDPTKHSVYFNEKDLSNPGKVFKLSVIKSDDGFKFLPSQVAKLIPFTSSKLPDVLNIFSLNPKSTEAKIMEDSLRACEMTLKGENKFCATTLESMVDYVTSHVGNNVTILSTYVDKLIEKDYKVESAKKIGNDANVVCHKMGYPYAVFYCHNIKNTNMYDISAVDNDGKKMNLVGVCHQDTSSWSPTHVSFLLLNVKPGSPVCHFLNERSIAWVPKS